MRRTSSIRSTARGRCCAACAGRANLTANIYTEMPNDTVRTELKKLPWIDKNGIQIVSEDRAPKHALKGDPEGQTASSPDKTGKGEDRSKYVDSPLKRRVLAALDTLRQNVEMVDATGLAPVTPCVWRTCPNQLS